MGIALRAGRSFTRADLAGIQRRFSRLGRPNASGQVSRRWASSSDSPASRSGARLSASSPTCGPTSLTRDVPSWIAGQVYVPYTSAATQEDGRIPTEMTLVVRTASDALHTGDSLLRLVAGISREVAVGDVKTLQAYVSDSVATPASTT